MHNSEIIRLIQIALNEDIRTGDVTAESVFPEIGAWSQGTFIAKQYGIMCGLSIAQMVFQIISDNRITWTPKVQDGDVIEPGMVLATIDGEARDLLSGERTALNFMQRMSGIATLTAEYVHAIEGTGAKVLDTRKTIPGWRELDKYAVKTGGGTNHRMGLYDMAMIKDNHIAAAGGIREAIRFCKEYIPDNIPIEVEADTIQDVIEILECGNVQRILFDNFTIEQTKAAVSLVNKAVETESSGNITLQTIREYAMTGVDFISVGAITHSAPALDISLDIQLPQ
ncbi:MAG: carboxylating nicotinate-nucleotide diphosphorylase [Bacteroidota bacterium]|nr:carboxylating nicotinate-nucleotide diphosphorylase [bacterium]NBP64425.1 carboxylating nicotinate-nucleotide diphosphorylase [Bacteroidota bacterium]